MSTWILTTIGAVVAPIFVFLGLVWRLSGRITTSDAGRLWEEANSMRAEWRTRALTCESENRKLKNELQVITASNSALVREMKELRDELIRRTP